MELECEDLPLDLLDTDAFFSTDQLGGPELDMAGLAELDLLAGPAWEPRPQQQLVADVNLNPAGPAEEGGAQDEGGAVEAELGNAAGLDEDFQRMLSEWESHIGSLESGGGVVRATPPPAPPRPGIPASARLTPLRSPVLPRPGQLLTRLSRAPRARPSYAGPGPALSPIRTPPPCPLPAPGQDLHTTLEHQKRRMEWLDSNFQRGGRLAGGEAGEQGVAPAPSLAPPRSGSVKIIAAVSPGTDGQTTTRILSARTGRESLPRELIEKIKAASQGRKTIAIIEPVSRLHQAKEAGLPAVRSKPWQTAGQPRWRHVGIVSPLPPSNISDHDYCSSGSSSGASPGAGRGCGRAGQVKADRQQQH